MGSAARAVGPAQVHALPIPIHQQDRWRASSAMAVKGYRDVLQSGAGDGASPVTHGYRRTVI